MPQRSIATPQSRIPATRPRGRTLERALDTVAKILRRDGYAKLTIERVSAESGLAKTTIYRRWPTKASLCMALYLHLAGRELPDPDTGDVAKDLKHIANAVVHLQTRTVAGQAFVGLIAEAQLNPETRPAFLAEFAQHRREVTRRVLKRAIARGELRADTDINLVIDALGGAVTFRLLQGHAPLSPKFADALVKLVLSGCRAKPKRKGSAC